MTELELIAEARAWVAECIWADLEPEDIADLTDAQIRRGVNRTYDGGWRQFVRDCNP